MKNIKQIIMKSSLQRKLLVFIILVIVIISLISILMVVNFIQAINTYDKMLESINLINDIKTGLEEIDEAIQEYSVSKHSSHRQQVVKTYVHTIQNIKQLEMKIYSPKSKLIFLNLDTIFNHYYHKCIDYMDLLLLKGNEEIHLLPEYNQVLMVKKTVDKTVEKLMNSELENNDIFHDYIQSKTSNISITFLIILLATIVLSILFAWNFSKDIYQPIGQLVIGAEKISKGNFEFKDIPAATDDEVGYLTEVFNTMKKDLSKWIKDKEEQAKLETLLKEAELKSLQAQVNPHFLFNVLSIVTESVLKEETEHTLSVVEKITYLLRYSLTSFHREVTLLEEIRMVESYIYLQEKRFGDRITFMMNVPEDIPHLIIPSMTIQPMVENAIIHGTEKMIEGGKVEVSLEESDSEVIITIDDNGAGIKENVLKSILKGQNEQHIGHTTGIGIDNVMNRLHLFYGKENLLRIYSQIGKGTHVKIRYPKENVNKQLIMNN